MGVTAPPLAGFTCAVRPRPVLSRARKLGGERAPPGGNQGAGLQSQPASFLECSPPQRATCTPPPACVPSACQVASVMTLTP